MEKEWSPMPVSYPYQLTVKVWQLLIDLLLFSEDYAFFLFLVEPSFPSTYQVNFLDVFKI